MSILAICASSYLLSQNSDLDTSSRRPTVTKLQSSCTVDSAVELPYNDIDTGYPLACQVLHCGNYRDRSECYNSYDSVRALISKRLKEARIEYGEDLSARQEILYVLQEKASGQSNQVLKNRAIIIDRAISALQGMDPRYGHPDGVRYFLIDDSSRSPLVTTYDAL